LSTNAPTRRVIAKEWLRLGITGFGGPPAHNAMLRRLTTKKHQWLDEHEFNDALTATSLLPGPASTQLAIYCGWRLQGVSGGLIAGLGFILPGFLIILGLASVLLASHPPLAMLGAGAGAAATVPAIALSNARALIAPTRERLPHPTRWALYVLLGLLMGAAAGQWLVLGLLGTGVLEILITRPPKAHFAVGPVLVAKLTVALSLSLAWVALKVGALSYGGGFVIIPLMQHDVVSTYHWMTNAQFLNAVALGQVTPGPVVLTVTAVGYAAGGVLGAVLATVVTYLPSFLFIFFGGRHFARLRENQSVRAFLSGAGTTVLGAIAGASLPLTRGLTTSWQGVLAVLSVLVLVQRRRHVNVVLVMVLAAGIGLVVALTGFAV